MTALVPVTASCPVLLTGEQRTRLAVIANALELAGDDFALPAERAPCKAERVLLTEQRDALFDASRPAGKEVALQLFTRLLFVMSARGGDPGEMNMRAVMYVKAWQGLPLFALSKACDDAVAGVIGDGKWLPEPGVVRLRAETYRWRIDEEHALLSRVLGARALPSVDRGTVEVRRAAIARVRKAMRADPDPTPPVPEAGPARIDPALAAPTAPSVALASSGLFVRAGARSRPARRAPAPRKRQASGRKARAP